MISTNHDKFQGNPFKWGLKLYYKTFFVKSYIFIQFICFIGMYVKQGQKVSIRM